MSSGGLHMAVSVAVVVVVVYADHLDPRPLEVGVVALLGGLGPDVDTGRSALGSLVPQWIAPDVERGHWYGRRWFHVLPIRHRGPIHSPLLGLAIAALFAWGWVTALLRSRLTLLQGPDFGLTLGTTFLACWMLHLLMDRRRWMR